jgi:hypothetical protein
VAQKTIVLLLILALNNCASTESSVISEPTPNPTNGCAQYTNNKERLKCISELIATLEDIKNSSVVVSNQSIGRFDNEYVDYLESYCYVSKATNVNYLCFDIKRRKYEPTPSGKIIAILKTFGVGFIFGISTGLYISP